MSGRRQDRIPGPSQELLAQRLWHDMAAQLAERVGCCPIHGTHQLICAFCDVTKCGSAAEHLEMEALLDRAEGEPHALSNVAVRALWHQG